MDSTTLLESHKATIDRYLEHGVDPGSGIGAILENDLGAVMRRVDNETLMLMPELLRYLQSRGVPEAWGSAEKVREWKRLKRAHATAFEMGEG